MMTTVFLRITGWLRILVCYGLQFIQHVIGKLASKRVDQIRLKLLPELVDVLNCEIPKIKIVGKEGSRPCFGHLMYEAAATRTRTCLQQTLGFKDPHRLPDRPLRMAIALHEFGFRWKFVTRTHALSNNPMLDRLRYTQRLAGT